MGVVSNIQLRVESTLSESPAVGSASQVINQYFAAALAAGTGIGNSDTLYAAELNLAASGSVSIDVNGAANTDEFGNDLAMAYVQVIALFNDASSPGPIVFEGGASNPFLGPLAGTTPSIEVQPGGAALILCDPKGIATNSSSAHVVKCANPSGSGANCTGKLILIGRSA